MHEDYNVCDGDVIYIICSYIELHGFKIFVNA